MLRKIFCDRFFLVFKSKEWQSVTAYFFLSRIMIIGVGYLSQLIILKEKWFKEPGSLLDLFVKWDANWYLSIISWGYSYTPGKESNVIFFPLYPLTVKLFSSLFGMPVLMGYMVSNVALFIAGIYLFKLVKLETHNDHVSSRAVFYMMICPVSFFFSIIYSESLFLMLSILCYFYALKKKWLLMGITGFFLSLTRSVGLLITVPLIIEMLDINYRRWRPRIRPVGWGIAYLGLIPLGLISYMCYMYIKFGDMFAFLKASAIWGRRLGSFDATLCNYKILPLFYQIIFPVALLIALVLTVYLHFSKIRFSYVVYVISMQCFYVSSGLMESLPRYICVLFPLYIALALIGTKHNLLCNTITVLSSVLLSLFIVLFVNGYWFT